MRSLPSPRGKASYKKARILKQAKTPGKRQKSKKQKRLRGFGLGGGMGPGEQGGGGSLNRPQRSSKENRLAFNTKILG